VVIASAAVAEDATPADMGTAVDVVFLEYAIDVVEYPAVVPTEVVLIPQLREVAAALTAQLRVVAAAPMAAVDRMAAANVPAGSCCIGTHGTRSGEAQQLRRSSFTIQITTSFGIHSSEKQRRIVMKQKILQRYLILLTVGVCAVAMAQNQTPIQQNTSSQGYDNAVQSRRSALNILTPRPGQAVSDNFVTMRFELVRPNPGGSDQNFVVRLDGRDPVNTSETAFTFTEIRSGQHVLSVTEVDANGTPLPDARAEVQFSVKTPENTTQPAKSGSHAVPAK